jgi:hypothetical protein
MGILEKLTGKFFVAPPGRAVDEDDALRREIADLQRRNREYFEVIESIEKQRDEWKAMFFTQSAQHQVAQEMLQRRARQIYEKFAVAVRHLNEFLKQAGHAPVDTQKALDELSDDVAARYGERMQQMASTVSTAVDGEAERKRIAAG